jgi:hypothetical protein
MVAPQQIQGVTIASGLGQGAGLIVQGDGDRLGFQDRLGFAVSFSP